MHSSYGSTRLEELEETVEEFIERRKKKEKQKSKEFELLDLNYGKLLD